MSDMRRKNTEPEESVELEEDKEAAFSSDSHEDPHTGYRRDARYGGREKGSENYELAERQAEEIRKADPRGKRA